MAGTRVKFSYKQLHTMKHAIGQYMCREGSSEEDYLSEKHLYGKLIEEIECMKIRHHITDSEPPIVINSFKNDKDLNVNHGKIPNGLIPEFDGVIYYFQTSFAKSTKEHREAIEPIIEKVLSENDTNYTSWEVTKRETLVYTQISQVTVVSFRVRDAW